MTSRVGGRCRPAALRAAPADDPTPQPREARRPGRCYWPHLPTPSPASRCQLTLTPVECQPKLTIGLSKVGGHLGDEEVEGVLAALGGAKVEVGDDELVGARVAVRGEDLDDLCGSSDHG